jgi:acetyl-CoA carboxylase carboxyl transferase subunit alpha
MASSIYRLAFEQPIFQLQERIAQLEASEPKTAELKDEVRALRRELADVTKRVYSQLDPWETVQVARHPDRPMFTDYIDLVFDEFVELHGDKFYGDDRALRTGFAKLDRYKIMVVGHHKGKTLKERNECFFGCAHPEGYRKAFRKMKLAAKHHLPIVCLIDTPGAYPGIGAEERGQAEAIARSTETCLSLGVPNIAVILGEGGSGGAIAIATANRILMLEHAIYSVISPEGAASILWRDTAKAQEAATSMKITAQDMVRFGVIDTIVPEPTGGAHRDPQAAIALIGEAIADALSDLQGLDREAIRKQRREKFLAMGRNGS